jgi:hypothetical protein
MQKRKEESVKRREKKRKKRPKQSLPKKDQKKTKKRTRNAETEISKPNPAQTEARVYPKQVQPLGRQACSTF